MMEHSRTKNTGRNIISGLIRQMFNILLPFLIRTIILYSLGAEYQGLNGLFSSIIQILNLTDLGFSVAVTYILYKPIAAGDNDAICSILAYLKKVYKVIGSVILIFGVVLTPFLSQFISGEHPAELNIYLLFAIYLFNTVISYLLFAYKSALLNAMQRSDMVNNIWTLTTTIVRVVQIVLLLTLKDYYVYVLVLPIGTLVNNLLLEHYSKKLFPKLMPNGVIAKETKKELEKQIKAIFINRVGDVARNSLDDVVLSSFLGLTIVAIYDNYYFIYSALYGVMLVITQAMQASVGNSIATETVNKNYKDLKKFTFIYMILVGWCSVCLACLYQPFMNIWMNGNTKMLLSTPNMLLFCVYFYFINTNNTRNLYLTGNGLYWECRIWFIAEAIGNLVLNVLLGYLFGVTGIIIATIITIFVFNFITRTNILFKYYFELPPKEFYINHGIYLMITSGICAITYFLTSLINISGVVGLFVKAALCVLVPGVGYFIAYSKSTLFKESIKFCISVIQRRRGN